MENNLRDKVLQRVLNVYRRSIVLELATGVGKTKLALEKVHQLYKEDSKILIVIPRNVLIDNWKEEFKKWHYADMLPNVTFTTYVSLPKHAGHWDIVVFDEAHHLSERCQEALSYFKIKHSIFLSATLKREHKMFINLWSRRDVEFINVDTKKAIDNDVLPDPKIILIPLELDNRTANTVFEKRKAKPNEKVLTISYDERWKYKSYKGALAMKCTQRQYYNELSSLIEWYKRKRANPAMKNLWLHKCGERLQWLSMNKLFYTKKIIEKLHSRYVVFCNTIAESQALDIPMVNSQVGFDNLSKFNDKMINSLAAVNCLNEGINMVDCQVGIFNAINASEVMQVQKVGRELRHKDPILIIPYFKYTREDDIVRKWMEGFNKELIEVKTIDEL